MTHTRPARVHSQWRMGFAALMLALSAVTFFAPGSSILTPAHILFFDAVSRVQFGFVQLVAALLLLVPVLAPVGRYWAVTLVPALAVCITWAGVAFYPATKGLPWNVISLIAWVSLALVIGRACWPTRK